LTTTIYFFTADFQGEGLRRIAWWDQCKIWYSLASNVCKSVPTAVHCLNHFIFTPSSENHIMFASVSSNTRPTSLLHFSSYPSVFQETDALAQYLDLGESYTINLTDLYKFNQLDAKVIWNSNDEEGIRENSWWFSNSVPAVNLLLRVIWLSNG
jgi:hypothetical protein